MLSANSFDDWNPGKKAGIGQTVADFMQKHKAQIVCADPVDKDGPVDAGIITLENGNHEPAFTDSQYSSGLDICHKVEPKQASSPSIMVVLNVLVPLAYLMYGRISNQNTLN